MERHLLEAGLRDRVAALPSVRLRGRTTVLDLVVPIRGRIAGVIAADLDRPGEPARTLPADLVVDASGRGSRLLECLQKHGSPVPPVDRRRVDGLHVTRRFTLPDGLPMPGSPAANGVVVAGSAAGSAILVRVGERAWTVSLAGYRGVRPPLDLPGFIGHARAAGGHVADLLEALRPDGDPLSSWEPALVHRRFDLLREPLDGLVVVGDARCTLDAASGAGVAAAAMQAVVLREAAAGGGACPAGTTGPPRRPWTSSGGLPSIGIPTRPTSPRIAGDRRPGAEPRSTDLRLPRGPSWAPWLRRARSSYDPVRLRAPGCPVHPSGAARYGAHRRIEAEGCWLRTRPGSPEPGRPPSPQWGGARHSLRKHLSRGGIVLPAADRAWVGFDPARAENRPRADAPGEMLKT
ncbi:MAG: hypothetical protein R2719_10825 [Micropruina sp.]